MGNFNEKLGEIRGPAGGDKTGKRLESYIPIGEVADESVARKIDDFENKDLTPGLGASQKPTREKEEYTNEDKIKLEALRKKLESQTINFEQGEGAAHIGPDVKEVINIEALDKEKNKNRADKKMGEYLPNFISKFRRLATILPNDRISFRKSNRNTGEEHDNLKTMTPSKKERSERGEIRNFLDRFSKN